MSAGRPSWPDPNSGLAKGGQDGVRAHAELLGESHRGPSVSVEAGSFGVCVGSRPCPRMATPCCRRWADTVTRWTRTLSQDPHRHASPVGGNQGPDLVRVEPPLRLLDRSPARTMRPPGRFPDSMSPTGYECPGQRGGGERRERLKAVPSGPLSVPTNLPTTRSAPWRASTSVREWNPTLGLVSAAAPCRRRAPTGLSATCLTPVPARWAPMSRAVSS